MSDDVKARAVEVLTDVRLGVTQEFDGVSSSGLVWLTKEGCRRFVDALADAGWLADQWEPLPSYQVQCLGNRDDGADFVIHTSPKPGCPGPHRRLAVEAAPEQRPDNALAWRQSVELAKGTGLLADPVNIENTSGRDIVVNFDVLAVEAAVPEEDDGDLPNPDAVLRGIRGDDWLEKALVVARQAVGDGPPRVGDVRRALEAVAAADFNRRVVAPTPRYTAQPDPDGTGDWWLCDRGRGKQPFWSSYPGGAEAAARREAKALNEMEDGT